MISSMISVIPLGKEKVKRVATAAALPDALRRERGLLAVALRRRWLPRFASFANRLSQSVPRALAFGKELWPMRVP